MADTQNPDAIPIDSLDLRRLKQVLGSLEQTVQMLQTRIQTINKEKDGLNTAKESLDGIEKKEEVEVLVPVTESMYVPGFLYQTDKILCDIGTNFFVEKHPSEAIELLDRKIRMCDAALEGDGKELTEKTSATNQIKQKLNQRVKEMMDQQRATQQQGASTIATS